MTGGRGRFIAARTRTTTRCPRTSSTRSRCRPRARRAAHARRELLTAALSCPAPAPCGTSAEGLAAQLARRRRHRVRSRSSRAGSRGGPRTASSTSALSSGVWPSTADDVVDGCRHRRCTVLPGRAPGPSKPTAAMRSRMSARREHGGARLPVGVRARASPPQLQARIVAVQVAADEVVGTERARSAGPRGSSGTAARTPRRPPATSVAFDAHPTKARVAVPPRRGGRVVGDRRGRHLVEDADTSRITRQRRPRRPASSTTGGRAGAARSSRARSATATNAKNAMNTTMRFHERSSRKPKPDDEDREPADGGHQDRDDGEHAHAQHRLGGRRHRAGRAPSSSPAPSAVRAARRRIATQQHRRGAPTNPSAPITPSC